MKRIAPRGIVLALALVLGLAACGGSGQSLYTLQKTRQCLVTNHVALGGTLDFVATTATGGALRARLPPNFVTIALGATTADADNIDQAYRSFHARNVGIDDVLRQQGNAIMLWHEHPSDADVATITGCLK